MRQGMFLIELQRKVRSKLANAIMNLIIRSGYVKNRRVKSLFKKSSTVVFSIMAMSLLRADTYTINSGTPGDISDVEYWKTFGYSSLPGVNDTVYLNLRAVDPTFTASNDMSIYNIKFGVSGAFIDLKKKSPEMKINAPDGKLGMDFEAKKSGYKISGGTWNFVNGAYLFCGHSNKDTHNDGHNITFDGAVVTNVNRFYGAFYDRSTTVEIINNAKVYAYELRGVYGKCTSNAVLKIAGGSKMVLGRRMVYDQLDSYDPATSEAGGNLLEVTGAGSLLSAKEPSFFGFMMPSNTWNASSGARIDITALTVGKGQSCGNRIHFSGEGTVITNGNIVLGEEINGCCNTLTMSDGVDSYNTGSYTIGKASAGNRMSISSARLSSGGYIIGETVSSSNNVLDISENSIVSVRGGHSIIVGKAGSCNLFEFSGGNLNFVQNGMICIGAESTASGNVCRVHGASTRISSTGSMMYDPFGAGSHNEFILEDGAVLNNRLYMATNSTYCVLRARGAVLDVSQQPGFIGDGRTVSRGNKLELLEGSSASFKSFSITSYDNCLFVSNSTFSADDPDRGIRLGYTTDTTTSSNCMISVAGSSAKVETTGALECRNFSRLHFLAPNEGWQTAPVQVDKVVSFAKNTRLSIQCGNFAENIGGVIKLIHAKQGFREDNLQNVLAAANSSPDLPTGGRFLVSGNELLFRCPHRGRFTVVFR